MSTDGPTDNGGGVCGPRALRVLSTTPGRDRMEATANSPHAHQDSYSENTRHSAVEERTLEPYALMAGTQRGATTVEDRRHCPQGHTEPPVTQQSHFSLHPGKGEAGSQRGLHTTLTAAHMPAEGRPAHWPAHTVTCHWGVKSKESLAPATGEPEQSERSQAQTSLSTCNAPGSPSPPLLGVSPSPPPCSPLTTG